MNPACRVPCGPLSGFVLLACGLAPSIQAGDVPDTDPIPSPGGMSRCFLRQQARDFEVINRSTLIVFAPTRRHAFLVRISPPSATLRSAHALAFDSRTGQICGRPGDTLLLGTGVLNRYAVIDVRRLQPGEVDRAKGPGAPEPRHDTAADIEPVDEATRDPGDGQEAAP